jgi:hypothetical protein
MRHHDDLSRFSQSRETTTDFDCARSTDTGINLIEHESRDRVYSGNDNLNGEHYPRKLTTRCRLGDRLGFSARVWSKQEFDGVTPVLGEVRCIRDSNHELRRGHCESVQFGCDSGGQTLGSTASSVRQQCGESTQLGVVAFHNKLKFVNLVARAIQLNESIGRGGPHREHVVKGRAVRSHNLRDLANSFVDGLRVVNFRVEAVGVERYRLRGFLHNDRRFGQQRDERFDARVVCDHAFKRAAGVFDERNRVKLRLLRGECFVSFVCCAAQVVTVRQPLSDGLEVDILPGNRRHGVNLGDGGTKVVGFDTTRVLITNKFNESRRGLSPSNEHRSIVAEKPANRLPRETIEGIALRLRRSQAKLVALTVNRDERFADFAERAHRSGNSTNNDL